MRQKLFSLFLIFGIVLLAACSQNAPTWQEQYDLGVRYLSEGNYEEAIIAFTAAIEIDPKRPEAYAKAAEAYKAMGDPDSARAILEQGYQATGDESLQVSMEEVDETDSSTADRFLNDLSYVELEELSAEHQEVFYQFARLFQERDAEQLLQMIQEPAVYEIACRQYRNSDTVSVEVEGLRVRLGAHADEDNDVQARVEIRQKAGDGIYCFFDKYGSTEKYEIIRSETADWNLNGSFEVYKDTTYHDIPSASDTYWKTGTTLNGLIHGEQVTRRLRKEANEEQQYTEFFENGKLLAIGPQNEFDAYAVGYDLTNGGYYYSPAYESMKDHIATPGFYTSEDNDSFLWS